MILYRFGIQLYAFSIRLASILGHKKASNFLLFRKENKLSALPKQAIWIHAASAGEGNQAIPLANSLKKAFRLPIIISFYSPSGYEFHKDSPHFNHVINLSIPSFKNARHFVQTLQPKMAIFIKNELWISYLSVLKKEQIPAFLINFAFKNLNEKGIFYKMYQKKCLDCFDQIFSTQANNSLPNIAKTIGDTKFENAFAVETDVEFKSIKEFIRGKFCIIIGSSWPIEEDFMHQWLLKNETSNIKIIIAPHEISPTRIKAVKTLFKNSCTYDYTKEESDVLIVNQLGLLKHLYAYANLVVIGGGFGKGIHNILEAIAHKKPVIFGPKYNKFPEAIALLDLKIASTFSSFTEFDNLVNSFIKEYQHHETASPTAIENYIIRNKSIADDIIAEISGLI